MESNDIEFISRVYTKEESKYPKLRVAAKVFVILYVILFLFTFIIYGFSFEVIKDNIIPLFLLFNLFLLTNPKEGYKDTVVKVDLNADEMIITYDSIDRYDKMGPRTEKITIKYGNITKLEYSKELDCVNIQGYPIQSVKYLKQASQKVFVANYLEKKQEKRTLLYVSGEEKNKILNVLREKTNLKVTNVN